MTGPRGQPTNAVFGFTGDLLRLIRKRPDYLVCVFDAPGKTFRDELFEEYKIHRAPMPEELVAQLPVIDSILEAMRIPILRVPGYEADDAIATVARQAEAQGIEVLICTGDKDLRQLISDRVKVYNLRKDAVLDRDALKADWGISPEQVIDLLALMGDSVDNVPGVPGVGIKTAQKLLQDFGTIEGVLANIDKIKGNKVRQNVRAHAEKLELGRKLVRLAPDVPVPCDWEAWRLQPMNAPALLALFQECGFHRFANEVRAEMKAAEPVKPQPINEQADLFSGKAAPDSWRGDYQLIDKPDQFATFLEQLQKQKRFAIDLEMTSLIPQDAEIVGFAFAWEPEKAYYLAVRGPEGYPKLDPAETLRQLKPILESPTVEKVNQNIKYDLLVLRRAGVNLAGIAGDSMVADYLLTPGERNHNLDYLSQTHLCHTPIPISELIGKGKNQRRMDKIEPARVAEYSGEDADIAWRLCSLLEPRLGPEGLDKRYRELEIPLIEVLAELEYNGVKVDVPRLERLSADFSGQLAGLEREIYALAGHAFNIASPKQLRQVLFDELKLPKQRKTGITGEASTGQDVLEELAGQHELPRKIVEHRQIAKLIGTYVDALPARVNARTGRVHTSFDQTVAATGRLSSSDPNLQNIPARTDLGRQIRQAFVAESDAWVLLTADYSQIELRILAHYSGDAELQRAFKEDRDIHAYVASQIYGVPEDQVDRHQRRNAKTVNFGVVYGLSAFGLAKRLSISNDEASAFIDAYFARYPGVERFQTELLAEARRKEFLTTILGHRRRFAAEGIRKYSTYRQRNQAEREALNTVLQGSAADLIKQAMLNIHRRLKREGSAARMLLQIHDELVFEVPRAELNTVAALVAEEMTTAIAFNVPIKVDLAAGPNWLDVEPIAVER